MTRQEMIKLANESLDMCRDDGDEIEDNAEYMSDEELKEFINDYLDSQGIQ